MRSLASRSFCCSVSPPLRVDDGHLLNLLATWVPDATLRKTILVDNPATLYR
ncbi:MAG TPA: hypothetical protein VNX87_29340 [Candidatus Sulfotelmatobacter sp.]|jgi:predicted TIM-barrel fold metal-dependent hydrolase|nr:hypothetical protein [Candidatus Sulfotelmatobacter sp.]